MWRNIRGCGNGGVEIVHREPNFFQSFGRHARSLQEWRHCLAYLPQNALALQWKF